MTLRSDKPPRLTVSEAVSFLPSVIVGILRKELKVTVHRTGPGPLNRVALISGTGYSRSLHIDDWNLISDGITLDPETESDGDPDPDSPPPPDSVDPFRLGDLLSVKGETAENRQFNPRSTVNRTVLCRRDGSFRRKIEERVRELFETCV